MGCVSMDILIYFTWNNMLSTYNNYHFHGIYLYKYINIVDMKYKACRCVSATAFAGIYSRI